jgi:hypothetical protein
VLISEQKLHKGNKAVFDSVNRQTRRNLNHSAQVLIWKGDRKIEKMARNKQRRFIKDWKALMRLIDKLVLS